MLIGVRDEVPAPGVHRRHELARHYWRSKRLWSGSYFAGSGGGAPLDVLRIYIAQQRRPG
jgi:REP element-mobilizing transposase RayT